MPLAFADAGEVNIIKKIGGKPEVKQHLENLGFVVGGTVSIVFFNRRKSDCKCKRFPCCNKQGNGK